MLVLAWMSCSFTTAEWDACEAPAQCRDAFGWGWTCGDEGLCVEVEAHPRCDRTIPDDLFEQREANRDTIVIGSIYEREESFKDVLSFELAIGQVNDSEGLDGHLYGFVQCTNEDGPVDSLTQEEANLEVARYLADDLGVPAIVGPSYSSATEAAFLTVEPFGTLLVSPSATSPALTALDGLDHTDANPGLLWRTAPPDSLQGQAIALDVAGRGITDAAVIYQSGPYGEGLAQVFLEYFPGNASLNLFDTASVRDTATADVGSSSAQEVLFISSDKADIVAFLNGAGNLGGYATKGLFLADGAYDVNVLDQASSASDLFPNIRGTRPTTPSGPVYDTFLASYAAAYGGNSAADSAYTAYAFDAAWLVIYGTAWSMYQEGGVYGRGIARGLREVSSGDEVLVRATSWNTVKASFKAGTGVDVRGASGTLDYDPQTEETAAPIDVWTVLPSGDGFVVACTFDPSATATLPADCLPVE
ncbi:MAG: ABC transporter substrate-binding protein [Myxococcota bacterium]